MIKHSKYLRQGVTTLNVRRMSGGVYGCDIDYDYGVFSNGGFVGMTYRHNKYTEIESDSDEKDGIGGMTTVRRRSLWIGEFKDGVRNGFCYELKDGRWDRAQSFGIYEADTLLSVESFIEKSQHTLELSVDERAYCLGHNAMIFKGDRPAYIGNVNENAHPHGLGVRYDGDGNVTEYGRFEDGEFAGTAFSFESWEEMPVDPVDEDGFSVLRESTFFNDGDARYEVTEGQFSGGKLNGFGLVHYDSNVNGYHKYYTKTGLFCDGKLVFGYNTAFENTGGKSQPDKFGYADGRAVCGDEIIFNGKKYVGETQNGIPCGIGCLYETHEKMYKGTFCNGLPHGIGATYKLIDGKWTPYDYERDCTDTGYSYGSWGIFAEGEKMPGMTWEEFFDKYEPLKKV